MVARAWLVSISRESAIYCCCFTCSRAAAPRRRRPDVPRAPLSRHGGQRQVIRGSKRRDQPGIARDPVRECICKTGSRLRRNSTRLVVPSARRTSGLLDPGSATQESVGVKRAKLTMSSTSSPSCAVICSDSLLLCSCHGKRRPTEKEAAALLRMTA